MTKKVKGVWIILHFGAHCKVAECVARLSKYLADVCKVYLIAAPALDTPRDKETVAEGPANVRKELELSSALQVRPL